MPNTTAERKWLEKRLGDFLGFQDDSLAEVLDHLLSIENDSDLLDYLEQLLGTRDDDVRAFVKNIGRFQKGEALEGIEEGEEAAVDDQKPAAVDPSTPAANSKKSPAAKDNNKSQPKSPPKAAASPPKSKSPPAAAKEAAQSPKKANNPEPKQIPPVNATCIIATTNTQDENKPPPKKKYGLPPKGKPKFVCGCFGTLHKPLTNCLYCGRISCAEEGYDFCAFCGYLVEEVQPPTDAEKSKDKAWQHKERLLRYDRDSAKRTVVLDDQADYYSNQTSTWLTDAEQAEAEEQNAQQRRDLHTRKKQTLNIAF